MPAIPIGKPESIGIDPAALRRADDLVQRWLTDDRIPAAGWTLGRRGRIIEPRLVGRQRPAGDAPALRRDALFVIASITKPVTATAIMMLLERGSAPLYVLLLTQERLADPVSPCDRSQGQPELHTTAMVSIGPTILVQKLTSQTIGERKLRREWLPDSHAV